MNSAIKINELETKINAGLKAARINWATARAWYPRNPDGGTARQRVYLNVGKQSDGYVEVEGEALYIHGLSRIVLFQAVQAMLPEAKRVK